MLDLHSPHACHRSGWLVILFLMAIGLPSRSSSGAVVLVPASQDNTIFSEVDSFSNGAGEFLFAGRTRYPASRRALIKFDLDGFVPSGATINSVSVQLTMSRTVAGNADVSFHRLTTEWGESTSDSLGDEGAGIQAAPGDATWLANFFGDSLWINAGGDFVPTASATQSVGSNGAYQWSSAQLAADVQAWVNVPGTNQGWILIGDEGRLPLTEPTAKRFNSSQHADVSSRPLLQVDFTPAVPEPSSFLMGLAVLYPYFFSRRR